MFVQSVTEAKAQLSKLIELALAGEEVVIARAGKPAVILLPYPKTARVRKPGVLKGKIRIAEDFDDLPDDIAESLGVVPD